MEPVKPELCLGKGSTEFGNAEKKLLNYAQVAPSATSQYNKSGVP